MGLNQFENRFNLNSEAWGFECTKRFYTLLAFQRHDICYFWIYGLKDMVFSSDEG
jgi:hypothetical protein